MTKPGKQSQSNKARSPAQLNRQRTGQRMGKPRHKAGSGRVKSSKKAGAGLVGLLVFMLGLTAVLAAGYVVYQKGPVQIFGVVVDLKAMEEKLFGPPSDKQASRDKKKDTQSKKKQRPPPWYEGELSQDGLPEVFEGRYVSHFGSRQFGLYLKDGIYQIVLSRNGDPQRIFSRGEYGYKDGLLALRPDIEAPKPPDEGEGEISYRHMTDKLYTIELSFQNNYVFWDPGRKHRGESEVVVKHPVFVVVDANRLVWKPLSADSVNR